MSASPAGRSDGPPRYVIRLHGVQQKVRDTGLPPISVPEVGPGQLPSASTTHPSALEEAT